MQVISFATHLNDSSTFLDTAFSMTFDKIEGKFLVASLSYREVEQNRLQAPYQTMCRDMPQGYSTGLEYRLDYINNETKRPFHHVVPYIVTSDSTLDYRFTNTLTFNNHSFLSALKKMLSEKIPIECHTKYFITSGQVIKNDENVQISLSWPQTEKL